MTPLMLALFATAPSVNANTISTATRVHWAGALGLKSRLLLRLLCHHTSSHNRGRDGRAPPWLSSAGRQGEALAFLEVEPDLRGDGTWRDVVRAAERRQEVV
jgi:hypothetical protein